MLSSSASKAATLIAPAVILHEELFWLIRAANERNMRQCARARGIFCQAGRGVGHEFLADTHTCPLLVLVFPCIFFGMRSSYIANKPHHHLLAFLLVGAILFCSFVSAQTQITLEVDGPPYIQQSLSNGDVVNLLITFDNSSSTVLFVNATSYVACGLNINLTSSMLPAHQTGWSTMGHTYSFYSWNSGQYNLQLTGTYSTCNLTAVAQSKSIVPIIWNEPTVFAYDRNLPFPFSLTGNLTLDSGGIFTAPFVMSAVPMSTAPPHWIEMQMDLYDANGRLWSHTYTDYHSNLSYVDGDGVGVMPSLLYGVMSDIQDMEPQQQQQHCYCDWNITFFTPRPVPLLPENGPPLLVRAPYPEDSTYEQLILSQTSFAVPVGLNGPHTLTATLVSGECLVGPQFTYFTPVPTQATFNLVLLSSETLSNVWQVNLSSPSQWVLNWYQGESNLHSSDDCSFEVLLDVDHTQSVTTTTSLTSTYSSSSSSRSASLSSTATVTSSSLLTSTSTTASSITSCSSTASSTALLSATLSMSIAQSSASTAATTTSGGGGAGKVDLPVWGAVLIVIGAFLLGLLAMGATCGIIMFFRRTGYETLLLDA